MKVIKILHVISSLDPSLGGPSEGVRQLTKAASALGAAPTVISMDPPDAPFLNLEGAETFGLGPGLGTFAYSRKLIPWIREHAHEFDAVIVNGLWQFHLPATWWALKNTSVPYLVYPHGMLDPWFKSEYPLKHMKKSLYWWLIQHRALAEASGVLFTCEEERMLAPQSFKPYRLKEYVVNYGTSLPAEAQPSAIDEFYEAHPSLIGKRLFLFLGRLHEKKGCDLLLQAFATVAHQDNRLRLVMAGPDQTGWRTKLERMAEDLGIADRVVWPGMIKGVMKWGAFMASELFVLPSHQENFGIAVAEALAVGTPVLISNKVNIWREVQGDSGGLVCDDTAASLAEAFKSWLARTPAEMAEARVNAKACFEKRFDIRGAANRMLKVAMKATQEVEKPIPV